MTELQPNSIAQEQVHVSSDEDECEQDVPDPPVNPVKAYEEALDCLKDVCMFLEEKGHTEAGTVADI